MHAALAMLLLPVELWMLRGLSGLQGRLAARLLGIDQAPWVLPVTNNTSGRLLREATMNSDARRRWLGGETALGGLLVLLGTLVLLGQALELELGEVGWPFFVILPGLGLLGLGLATPGRLGEVLAPVGGVVTMAGLVLLAQNATDQFDTWAYAWTLVFLVGAGSGRWLVGTMRGHRELAASGAWLVAAGLVSFLGLAVFFEVAVGLSGHRSGAASRYVLAALLILAGLVLLGRRLLAARRPWGQPRPDRGPDGRMGSGTPER